MEKFKSYLYDYQCKKFYFIINKLYKFIDKNLYEHKSYIEESKELYKDNSYDIPISINYLLLDFFISEIKSIDLSYCYMRHCKQDMVHELARKLINFKNTHKSIFHKIYGLHEKVNYKKLVTMLQEILSFIVYIKSMSNDKLANINEYAFFDKIYD